MSVTDVAAPAGVVVGRVEDVPPGEGRAFVAGGVQIAVFRLRDGSLHATQAACPHAGGPLADGQTDSNVLGCPLHRDAFRWSDGAAPSAETVASASASPQAAEAADSIEPSTAPDAATDSVQTPTRAGAYLALVPIVVIAMAGFSVEEFGNAWTSLFLQTERGLDAAVAGLGASTLLLAQFVGRLTGDRVLAALGRRTTLTVGLSCVVLGLLLVLFTAALPVVLSGLALCGLGCAVVVPTAYALGDEVPGLPAQTGLAIVSWLMRVAGIGLSPLVGLLATSMPLTPALLVFPVLAALGVLCSLVLHRAGHR